VVRREREKKKEKKKIRREIPHSRSRWMDYGSRGKLQTEPDTISITAARSISDPISGISIAVWNHEVPSGSVMNRWTLLTHLIRR